LARLGHYGGFPASSAISRPPPLPIAASVEYGEHSIGVTHNVPGDSGDGFARDERLVEACEGEVGTRYGESNETQSGVGYQR